MWRRQASEGKGKSRDWFLGSSKRPKTEKVGQNAELVFGAKKMTLKILNLLLPFSSLIGSICYYSPIKTHRRRGTSRDAASKSLAKLKCTSCTNASYPLVQESLGIWRSCPILIHLLELHGARGSTKRVG